MAAFEVLALDTATPQIRAPGVGDTYSFPRNITPSGANVTPFTISGYSLTGSNGQSLVDLSGTWNTTGTPTALKLNVTDTASNAASLLFDLQTGGTSRFKVDKSGNATANTLFINSGTALKIYGASTTQMYIDVNSSRKFVFGSNTGPGGTSEAFLCGSATSMGWSSNTDPGAAGGDAYLARDAADVIAQRRQTNAQTFRVYGTHSNTSNYRRVAIAMTTAGVASIAPEGAGTGASGNVLHISGLPTANPGAGILWNDAGTVKVGT